MTAAIRRTVAIAAIAAAALLLAWYGIFFRREQHKLKVAHRAEAAAQANVTTLHNQEMQLQVLVHHLASDKAKLAALRAAVPVNWDLAPTLDQLQTAANDSGVALTSVAPGAPTTTAGGAAKGPGPASLSVAMNATGTYQQVLNFLIDVGKMPRVVVIDDLSLNGTSAKLTAGISARIFSTKPTAAAGAT